MAAPSAAASPRSSAAQTPLHWRRSKEPARWAPGVNHGRSPRETSQRASGRDPRPRLEPGPASPLHALSPDPAPHRECRNPAPHRHLPHSRNATAPRLFTAGRMVPGRPADGSLNQRQCDGPGRPKITADGMHVRMSLARAVTSLVSPASAVDQAVGPSPQRPVGRCSDTSDPTWRRRAVRGGSAMFRPPL